MFKTSKKTVRRRVPRSDKGLVTVTERDWRSMLWIAEQYAVRLDQVQSLLSREAGEGTKEPGRIGVNAARLVVARWQRAGLAERRKILAYAPAWVWLSAKGLHELGLPYKPCSPALARLEHLYAVNHVRLELERQHPQYVWYSERSIRADTVDEQEATSPHLPDGLLGTERGAIAIGVAVTPKKPHELQEILQELAQEYQEVRYFVAEAALEAVVAAQKKLDPSLAQRILISCW